MAHSPSISLPWGGRETLVLGLDIGTTLSAASIVHLTPGSVPKYRIVSRYPGAPNASKIPTVLLYSTTGTGERGTELRAVGAEAELEEWGEEKEEGRVKEVRYFKLLLNPIEKRRGGPGGAVGGGVVELPAGVDVKRCYSDMIRYIHAQARAWFIENTPDGDVIWKRHSPSLQVVLAHPNSYSVSEQALLTEAVQDSGILASPASHLHLVTEAEASVHFGLLYSESGTEGWMVPGASFVVVDAGGSTVDTCTYTISSILPKLRLREAKLSDCIEAGGIYVSSLMASLIRHKLSSSPFNTPEFLTSIMTAFDAKAKLLFSNAEENQIVKFGFDRDSDRSVGISRGRLTLSGREVEEAFRPSVEKVIESVRRQIEGIDVSHILLVGGYGESPYLQRRLRETFEQVSPASPVRPIRIVTVDEPSRKAVALGTIVYYSKDSVEARATRYEFGLSTNRPYTPEAAQGRQVISFSSGKHFLAGGWTPIVPKGKITQFNEPHRESFWVHKRPGDSLLFSTTIISFDGEGDAKGAYRGFSRDPSGNLYPGFQECCTITGDLTDLAIATPVSVTESGDKYRELDFQIGLFFGDTTLRACLIWKNEKGLEIRGPVSIVPASFV